MTTSIKNLSGVVVYVCGFLFDPEFGCVKLQRKNVPEGYTGPRLKWQDGTINGIGGLVKEEDESVEHALTRKYLQETGLEIAHDRWVPYATISGDGCIVVFLWAVANSVAEFSSAVSQTDEDLITVPVTGLKSWPVIYNLNWLIPMAMDKAHVFAQTIDKRNTGGVHADIIGGMIEEGALEALRLRAFEQTGEPDTTHKTYGVPVMETVMQQVEQLGVQSEPEGDLPGVPCVPGDRLPVDDEHRDAPEPELPGVPTGEGPVQE